MLPMSFLLRIGAMSALLAGGVLAACGSADSHANDTLPPIATTTTTTTMPPTTTTIPDSYVIQAGDTLFSIATKFGLDTNTLAAFNGIVNKSHIESGQKLKIPPKVAVTVTSVVAGTVTVATVVGATSTT